MILAQVCGNVVATHHESGFDAQTLKIVVKVFEMDVAKPVGGPFVVLDRIGANTGEFVLLETSMESCLGMSRMCASDAAIVAIVDKMSP